MPWATPWATATCPALLARLDEALWEVKLDPQKSEIGLLYGLISKVRAMLLLKEMLREGWVKPDMDYNRFKAQLERVPADQLPEDRRFNPLAINPYVLYKALPQVKRYSEAELIRAMDLLFQCNLRLVSSSLDESLVLQQTLVQIVGNASSRPGVESVRTRSTASLQCHTLTPHEHAFSQDAGHGGRAIRLHPDYRARQLHFER